MLFNYLKTALRAIRKDQQHFFLNLIGFSIGIAAAILMALFAQHELSYDKHQPDSERVYLAHTDYTAVGLQTISISSFRLAEIIKSNSQVESIFRLTNTQLIGQDLSNVVAVGGVNHRLNDFYMASANILDFVNLITLAGDISKTLSQPNLLALSEREALRIFGDIKVIGQSVNYNKSQYTIGAIFANLPENTHFKFDSLMNMPTQLMQEGNGYAYYKLHKGTDLPKLTKLLITQSHAIRPWQAKQNVNMALINMEDLHLKSHDPAAMKSGGSSTVLQISIGLSVILIIIASINFINLAIAQSSKRAKEVGVRKVLGASKTQLIIQFLTESFLVVLVAGLMAFALVELTLPDFNRLMGRELYLDFGAVFIWEIVAVMLAVGLLSGLYPAVFISSFSAKRVLNGDLVRGSTAIFVRKLTLIFQAALSISLIIAAVFLYKQIQLINALDVGYEKSSRLIVKSLPSEAIYQQANNSLFAAIKDLPSVEQVTASNTNVTDDMEFNLNFVWPNGQRVEGMQPTISTGYYPIETMGLTLLAGRDFTPQFSGDWYYRTEDKTRYVSVIVSRRMAELAGYQDINSVIGLTLTEQMRNMKAKVVGVIENVKIGSARQQVLPMSLNLGFFDVSVTSDLVIKTRGADIAILSKQLKQLISKDLHLSDVEISQLTDDYANAHKNEHRALNMVTIFSCLTIFLMCLGTFGLASFATLRRQKEVAMRKVLGASRLSIMNLLAKEFLVLVVISIVIAFPLTYWLVGDWLANFNDRIEQEFRVYVLAAFSVVSITWLTVASLAFKAASTRPSLILRDE
ncbi:ABC transporter permease [Pseudoalteromonas sp. NBT06-2]|uniref:ABC transporter permease n=1 Tax=Pseudoalteromonas sp. NBT06-2 TaxID=2025950 RepID=UPI000BA62AF9|nr:ABC transporter permease [Pseudoalteromonas sp. NBT06-2]PAJ75954.1 ABC transporter permease [Pseudoalteromonas sp. NBT06-2]